MVLHNTIINKDLAAMTLIYFILDIPCQWARLQAVTYHRRGMVSPAPLLLTPGKRMRLTRAAAFTRAKTEVGRVDSPRPQTETHSQRCTCSLLCLCLCVLQTDTETCVAHHDYLHNRIQNWRYTIIRRRVVTQRNRPGKKDLKKNISRW